MWPAQFRARPAPWGRALPWNPALAVVLAVAMASIAAGVGVIASGAAGHSLFTVASHERAHHLRGRTRPASRARPPASADQPPLLIPAAPDSTDAATNTGVGDNGPAPASSAATAAPAPVAGLDPGDGPGPVAHSRVAAPPAAQGAPLPIKPPSGTVSDPSEVATAEVRSIPLYASPGAAVPTTTLANPNYLGARVVLLVTGYQPGWVQAYIPIRPNETTAWVPVADVSLSWVTEHLVVHLGAKTITLYRDDAPVFSARVAPGAPDSPTPTGLFFVAFIVKVSDPGGPYGPYALGTSDFSGTYMTFEGGPGQIGIHGTDQPWVIGTDASHGCIRLYNSDIATLAPQIVPGIPVDIVS